jgi:zinc transport system substrate-binding protein
VTTDSLVVFTVNYPLAYFAERIGSDVVEVRFPAPADEDPAYWSPDADTIAAYQAADLILLNGAAYAKWVERATLPSSKLVDTSASFAERYIPLEGTVTHSHGPEGAHEHTGWAFTTWLDPSLAIKQARAVRDALTTALPDHTNVFEEGFTSLSADLEALDQRVATAAEAIDQQPLIFSHPVYQYLIARYGLNGMSVHWEPDQAPNLDELQHLLEEQAARWIVWEGSPLLETVESLEAYAVTSVVFDPCGNRPDGGDFMSVMESNAKAFERIAGL